MYWSTVPAGLTFQHFSPNTRHVIEEVSSEMGPPEPALIIQVNCTIQITPAETPDIMKLGRAFFEFLIHKICEQKSGGSLLHSNKQLEYYRFIIICSFTTLDQFIKLLIQSFKSVSHLSPCNTAT